MNPADAKLSPAARALMLQFLSWIDCSPRTYSQTLEAWRSSCPRNSIWEDALAEGLVQIQQGESTDRSTIILTAKGRALLADR